MKAGMLLSRGTMDLALEYKDHLYHLDTMNKRTAENDFPSFPEVPIRALCATNLEDLESRLSEGFPLVTHGGYNPERRACTPRGEWRALVRAARNACIVCEENGVEHLFGPGMRLALNNRDRWHRMAPNVSVWYMQLQIYQLLPLREFVQAVAENVHVLQQGGFYGPVIGQLSLAHNTPLEVYSQAMVLEGIVTAVRFLHMKDLPALADVLMLMYGPSVV